jgi:hypothetical protein
MTYELDEDGYDLEEPPKRIISAKGFSIFIWLKEHPKWMKNHHKWILENMPEEEELNNSEDE